MAALGWIRRYMWVVPVLIGLVFVGAGVYMITEGLAAKNEVHNTLVAEQIITSDDATIPGALVDSAATARAQEELIREHTLGEMGPYSGMERDGPQRETYLKGVTLRNALNMAVLGFNVSNLVIGIGVIVVVMGLTNITVMAPVLFWTRGEAPMQRRLPAATAAGAIR